MAYPESRLQRGYAQLEMVQATVSTSVSTVTADSGTPFIAGMVGFQIRIDGAFYTIASFTSTTIVVLTTVIGTKNAVAAQVYYWGVIPHAAGVATVVAADCFLSTDLVLKPSRAIAQRPDKTGSYSQPVPGITKRGGTWRMRCTLAGSGSAGTAPDIDPFLVALFGKVATVVGGASVTYALEDGSPSLTLWDFNALAAADQQVAIGCIVTRATIEWGQDFAFIDLSGDAKYVLRSSAFSAEDATAKSGLTAFPTEPSTQTTAGTSVRGYKGTITLDAQTYTTFRSGRIEIAIARELDKAVWNSDYPGPVAGGLRSVSATLTHTDDDSANLLALKNKLLVGTPFDATIAIGATAGNIWTISLNDCIGEPADYGNGQTHRTADLAFSAYPTSATSKNEIALALT